MLYVATVKMSVKGMNVVRRLYVFCPDLGRREGDEHKKLLFYHPKSDSNDFQIQTIGFAEAVIGFADTFTGGDGGPYFEISTDKDMQINCRFENNYIIGVGVGRQMCVDQKYAARARVFHNVLRRMYSTFVLFFGKFDDLVVRRDGIELNVDKLKDRLEYFCGRYLLALRLHQLPLLDLLDGVTYMKLGSVFNFLCL